MENSPSRVITSRITNPPLISPRGAYVPAQLQFSIKSSEGLTFPDWRSGWVEPAKYSFSMPVTLKEKRTRECLGGRSCVRTTQSFKLLILTGLFMGALDRFLLKAVSSLWRRLNLLSWFTNLEPAVVALQSLRIRALPANLSPQGLVVLSSPLMETLLVQLFCGWLILRQACELITQCRTHKAP